MLSSPTMTYEGIGNGSFHLAFRYQHGPIVGDGFPIARLRVVVPAPILVRHNYLAVLFDKLLDVW